MPVITKAFVIDSKTGVMVKSQIAPSKQIEDIFAKVSAYGQTLMTPPINLEQLVQLSEAHPMHGACLEQKIMDIVASGFDVSPKSEEEEVEQKNKILDWWEGMFEEYTSLEVLQAMWGDYETLGWGALELARDVNGIIRHIYHIPGHTLRAHRNKELFVQRRQAKMTWFKRWGIEQTYYASSGRKALKDIDISKQANEILVFKKPCRRSTWYGIPVYISGIGHIALAVAARDFNVKFFENYREPRHLIVITGLDEDIEKTADDIELIWKTQLRDNPHRNVLLPISGDANVVIEKMGLPINDIQFSRLMEQTDSEILVAHRMPPDRLGIAKRGFLGGSVAKVVNEIYKDGVVNRGQRVLESRLQRFVEVEFKKEFGKEVQFKVDFKDLDVTDETMDVDIAINLAKFNLLTLNEARARIGKERHKVFEDMTLAEYLQNLGVGFSPAMMASTTGTFLTPTQKEVNEQVLKRLENIDILIEQLISEEKPS